MNVSVFFHGKPQSKDSFPSKLNQVEQRICNEFFKLNVREYNEVFVSQVIRDNNKSYAAYTFYHNGIDVSSRGKGYFAITVMVESEMFSQITQLYEFLSQSAYTDYICGSHEVINKQAQYQVGSFAAKARVFDEIADVILRKLKEFRVNPIDNTCKTQSSLLRLQFENPLDYSDAQIDSMLRKDGIVCLSMNKPTKKDEIIQQLETENKKLRTDNNKKDQLLRDKDQTIHDLEGQLSLPSVAGKGKWVEDGYEGRQPPAEESSQGKGNIDLKGFRLADFIIVALLIVSCVISCYSCSSHKEESVTEETNTEVVKDSTVVVEDTTPEQQVTDMTTESNDEETSQPENVDKQSKDAKDQPTTDATPPEQEENKHRSFPSPSSH